MGYIHAMPSAFSSHLLLEFNTITHFSGELSWEAWERVSRSKNHRDKKILRWYSFVLAYHVSYNEKMEAFSKEPEETVKHMGRYWKGEPSKKFAMVVAGVAVTCCNWDTETGGQIRHLKLPVGEVKYRWGRAWAWANAEY